MLMLPSMALVGVESGAEGEDEEGCRGGARKDSLSRLASKVKGQGGGCSDLSYRWVEGVGSWPLESLSQVPLWKETEKHVYMESEPQRPDHNQMLVHLYKYIDLYIQSSNCLIC